MNLVLLGAAGTLGASLAASGIRFGAAQRTEAPPPANDSNRTALRPADRALYRLIFAAQAGGDIAQADALIARLADPALVGHVLYQRYTHPTAYRPGFGELRAWLASYADLPGADRIYRLAMARMPKDFKGGIARPRGAAAFVPVLPSLAAQAPSYAPFPARTPAAESLARKLKADVRAALRRGAPTAALQQMKAKWRDAGLDAVEKDQLKGEIARAYLDAGLRDKARDTAREAALRSGEKAPGACWVAAMLAWRDGSYAESARLFRQVAVSPFASGWLSAGGSYWAYRAYERAGDGARARGMLQKAASHPRTFYGMIATRALGRDNAFDWKLPPYTAADRAVLSAYPAFRRADALASVGQYSMAEGELASIDPESDPALPEALMAYAAHAGLPGLALRLAEGYRQPQGGFYDAALYPLSPWKPRDGYRIDEALLHALIRQESRFDPEALSPRGATGLMQLMPGTASSVSGNVYAGDPAGRHALKDPRTNLDIGQRYVQNLANSGPVGSELMSLLIAYNAGPGNLSRWKQRYADVLDDPLMFIETIPIGETREYVERVMANYWIYRMRLGQRARSLDDVAEGRWVTTAFAQPAMNPPRKDMALAAR